MRKILSILIALMLVFTMSAFAEEVPTAPMIELDFGHFTMTIPEDNLISNSDQ